MSRAEPVEVAGGRGDLVKPIRRFSLERHQGAYDTWPTRSRLLIDGERTGLSLPGYALLHQFETSDVYLLVTDYECPCEEVTNVVLVSKKLRLQSRRWIGWMYASALLRRVEWVDERNVVAVIDDERRFLFTIRSWWIPYVRPRLRMKHLRGAG